MTERATYSAFEGQKCLYEASTLHLLKQAFITENESTQMYCPAITGIRLHIDGIEIDLPWGIVSDFIDELQWATEFLTWEDEDVKRFEKEQA